MRSSRAVLRATAFAFASSFALAASTAHAQPAAATVTPAANGDGLDTHLFRPALDSKGFFHTNGTDILGHNDISIGLVIDYGRNLLRVADRGQSSPQLINHSFQGTFAFNYGIKNAAVVGLMLPVNLMSGDQKIDRQVPPQPTMHGRPSAASPSRGCCRSTKGEWQREGNEQL